MDVQELGNKLIQHYMIHLLSSSPTILASLEMLGNPAIILQNLATGLKDFIFSPILYFTFFLNIKTQIED